MLNPDPFEVHPIEAEPRSWQSLLWSVIAHAVIILALLLNPPMPSPDAGEVRPSPDAQTIALPPNTRFEQQRRPDPIPERPIPLGPDSRNPDAPIPQEQGDQTPPPPDPPPVEDPADEDPSEADEAPPPTIPTPRDLQSGGRVLGPGGTPVPGTTSTPDAPPAGGMTAGRTRVGSMGAVGMRTQDARVFTQSFPEAAGRCVDIPDLGRNPDGTPVLASVIGVVRDQRGRPLPGAHLVIVGKPYSTFSDGQGNYRLEFDPSLLERCRVQYVRVSASGYRYADLTLAIGRNVRSDDVFLRRN